MVPDQLKTFLQNEVVCSLAVAMPHGEVHVAPLLFWSDTDTLKVYISTSIHTEKMWWYPEQKSINAAVAIGLQKKLPFSLQMRGRLEEINPDDNPNIASQYNKIASSLDDITKPDVVMLVFTPSWARYTDRADGYSSHGITLAT